MTAQQATVQQQASDRKNQPVTSGPNPWAQGLAGFAGALMILGGLFQAFQGLAALFSDDFFFAGFNYIFAVDVTTWGWVHLIVGIILTVAGFAVFSGKTWARVTGIVLAMLSATVNFFFIPYYPLWSILIITLDIAIIWGLANYTRRQQAAPMW